MEGYARPHPGCHAGDFAVVAKRRNGGSAPAQHFLLWDRARFSAYEPKWATVRVGTSVGKNLDRRLYLHNVSGTLPDNQQPDERIAKAAGEN